MRKIRVPIVVLILFITQCRPASEKETYKADVIVYGMPRKRCVFRKPHLLFLYMQPMMKEFLLKTALYILRVWLSIKCLQNYMFFRAADMDSGWP
jgi:hypothetical protein